MRKTYTESPKMPGSPKRRQERPRTEVPHVDSVSKASTETPVRAKLGWSRAIVDHARGASTPQVASIHIPNVKSQAAMRARAGEAIPSGLPIEWLNPPDEMETETAHFEPVGPRPVARAWVMEEPLEAPTAGVGLIERAVTWFRGLRAKAQ